MPPAWIPVALGSNANVDTVSCYITHGDSVNFLHTAGALWVERDVKGAIHKPKLRGQERHSAYSASDRSLGERSGKLANLEYLHHFRRKTQHMVQMADMNVPRVLGPCLHRGAQSG